MPPDSRVDELRERLRSLGYLNAGVDRFVLAPARDTRRPAAIALLASVRIGVLGGLLLGPAAAIGLSARLPGLVTGPRDALVVALYLALLFGLAIAILSFIACLLVARLTGTRPDAAPRARRLAVGAGTIAAAGSLAYLTLWWRAAGADLGTSAPVWTAFALAVAAAISVLLGHAITVAALAVSAAGREEHAALPRVPDASWKATLAAGALALGGAITLLLATARAEEPAPAAAPLAVRPTGSRITVLAIDGFDEAFHERLRPGPAVSSPPGLSTVLDRARATLAPSESRDPARLWTTIATGRRAEAHGVEALETRRVAGLSGRVSAGALGRLLGDVTDVLRLTRPTTASDLERRVKTLWEVAAGTGLRTAVVNWWATWPAPEDAGIVISDRAILRLERGGVLDAEIAPADLHERLRARWPELQARARQQIAVFAFMSPPDHEPITADTEAVLRRSGEIDAVVMALAAEVEHDLDLLVIYLPGLDIVQHTLLGDAAGQPGASTLQERLAALRRYYLFLNRLVGSTIGRARDDRHVFLIAQPGRLHEGPGVMAAAGETAAHGVSMTGTVLDAAPTILHALGVPVSRELDGHVLEGLFKPGFLAAHPVRHVESYGLRAATDRARTGKPLDQEMIDRLRSLGYVR